MAVDIANWVRIFAAVPDDELVVKRTAAVKDLAAKLQKQTTVPDLLGSADDIARSVQADADIPEALAENVQTIVRKTAAAFVAAEAPLEVTVCALMAALWVLDGAKGGKGEITTTEVFALGLWLALGFQEPRDDGKLEELRLTVLDKARSLVLASASTTRERHAVADVDADPADPFDAEQVAGSIDAAVNKAIAALRINAQLDREELDLLWWVLGDWSELLNARFDGMENAAARGLAAGLEAGSIIRRMPSDGHRHLVFRQGAPTADELSLVDLLAQLGELRAKLAGAVNGSHHVLTHPRIFALLHAIQTGTTSSKADERKRPMSEWTERALIERASLRVFALLGTPGK